MRCKQGDLAIVECGAMGADSPNVGLIVECVSVAGTHSVHGPVWNVKTSGPREIVSEFGATGLTGQAADEWLRPIPKDSARPDPGKKTEPEKVDA
jgi:hypothetical protein